MSSRSFAPLPDWAYRDLINRALAEDLGAGGDITSQSIVGAERIGSGQIGARASGCLAGVEVAGVVFRSLDPEIEYTPLQSDGSLVEAGRPIAQIRGSALALLAAERTALNLLGRLSGIATSTRELARSLEGTPAALVDTRKTTPGLRALEKFAVRCGGGRNHRFGLYDAVLIKDNHIALAGGITEAVRRVRDRVGHLVAIECEVDDLNQLEEALAAGVKKALLDNFSLEDLRTAVQRSAGNALLEASGGIVASNIREVAETGVDLISLGWITHSAPALDVGLDLTMG